MGQTNPGKSHGLTGMVTGQAREELSGQLFGRVWNQIDSLLRWKPVTLAGYPHPFLTLTKPPCSVSRFILS
jgi:hypothetical protein